MKQLKRDHKSQLQTTTKPRTVATVSTVPLVETPASSELSMASLSSDVPEDWHKLAEYALEEEVPITAEKLVQPQ